MYSTQRKAEKKRQPSVSSAASATSSRAPRSRTLTGGESDLPLYKTTSAASKASYTSSGFTNSPSDSDLSRFKREEVKYTDKMVNLITQWIQEVNVKIAKTKIGYYFHLEGSGHAKARKGAKFCTELFAGMVTFFAMAYIISVNATILKFSGGPCVCTNTADPTCATDEAYAVCLDQVHRDFITGTAAVASITTFCMGAFANLPIALAPGMGLNAYFAYSVVGYHGTGSITYREALMAVFLEGLVFFVLTLLGLRQYLARLIPRCIKVAMSVGIGLYLSIIGLSYSAGIGLISGGIDTPVTIAGCLPEQLVDGHCAVTAALMRSPTMWIGIFCGGFLTVVLLSFRFKGAVVTGILLVAIISWSRDTPVTMFPHTLAGDNALAFFKKIVDFHTMSKTLNAVDWSFVKVGDEFARAFFTFLFVDLLDSTATMYTMALLTDLVSDTKTGDFENSTIAFCIDAIGISIGALFGLSPVTAFTESSAGILAGGMTGLTAMTTGVFFFFAMFFAPIFTSIPPWATGCALLVLGSVMARGIVHINWKYVGDWIPGFLTFIIMPFTYSVAYGLIAGITSYIILNLGIFLIEKISFGHFKPENKDCKDPWTYKIGGFPPKWMVKLFRRFLTAFCGRRFDEEGRDKLELPRVATPAPATTATFTVIATPRSSRPEPVMLPTVREDPEPVETVVKK